MKRFTSEKAFTLVEMSVVLSVVALIGTLLVGGVVTANNNRVEAGVLEFFDKEIEKANENFKLEPQKILDVAVDRPEPYLSMHKSDLESTTPGLQYTGYYTENLIQQSGAITGTAKYQLLIRFEQEEGMEKEVDGFSRSLLSFKMSAMVLELTDSGYDYDNPLLERSYKGISVEGSIPATSKESFTVTYNIKTEDRDSVINNWTKGTKGTNTLTSEFGRGDSFYSQNVLVTSTDSDKAFVGWALDSNSREIIPADKKVTEDMTVWAVFSEYRLEFRLQEGQQFNTSVIQAPGNTENYFIERKFSEFPEGQTTIEKIPNTEQDKEIVRKLLEDEAKTQVIQAGYIFKGWRNAVTKQPVSKSLDGKGLATVLTEDDPYLQLEAVMEKIKADETRELKLSLDLTNYTVDNNRKFFLYGITDLEYGFTYDENEKTLKLVQTEYNTWNNTREEVSKTTFKIGDGYLSIADEKSNVTDSLESYIKDLMTSYEGQYVVLDRVSLTVKAPKFDSSSYRNVSGNAEKEKVYWADTNQEISDKQLVFLDAGDFLASESMKYQTKTLDDQVTNLPLDQASYDALNKQLLSWYGEDTANRGQVEIYNAGQVGYYNTNGSSVYTTTKIIESKTEMQVRYGSREITYELLVPLSLLNNTQPFSAANISLGVGVNSNKNIYISVSGTQGGGGVSLFNFGLTYQVDTGIPYKEYFEGQQIYNRISTIRISADVESTRYNVSSEVSVISGNGPTSKGWFDDQTLNEEYETWTNSKIKAVKDWYNKAANDPSYTVYTGCQGLRIQPEYCKTSWVGSSVFKQFHKGIWDEPLIKTNPNKADSPYVMYTSYRGTKETYVPYKEYSGDWLWGDGIKREMLADFEASGGNLTDINFEEKWNTGMNNRVTIAGVIPGESTKSEVTCYSFNNKDTNDQSIIYTSLPEGFVCR